MPRLMEDGLCPWALRTPNFNTLDPNPNRLQGAGLAQGVWHWLAGGDGGRRRGGTLGTGGQAE